MASAATAAKVAYPGRTPGDRHLEDEQGERELQAQPPGNGAPTDRKDVRGAGNDDGQECDNPEPGAQASREGLPEETYARTAAATAKRPAAARTRHAWFTDDPASCGSIPHSARAGASCRRVGPERQAGASGRSVRPERQAGASGRSVRYDDRRAGRCPPPGRREPIVGSLRIPPAAALVVALSAVLAGRAVERRRGGRCDSLAGAVLRLSDGRRGPPRTLGPDRRLLHADSESARTG